MTLKLEGDPMTPKEMREQLAKAANDDDAEWAKVRVAVVQAELTANQNVILGDIYQALQDLVREVALK